MTDLPAALAILRSVAAHLDDLRLSGPAADTRAAIALLTKRDNVVRFPARARLVGSEWTRWEGVGS